MIRQFLAFSYGSWVAAAVSFFTVPVITLLIVPEEFGKAAMFTLALNFMHQTGLLGLDQSFMRMYHERERSARPALAVRCLAISLGATAVLACCALPLWQPISAALFNKPDLPATLLLAGCLLASVVNRYAMSVVRMNKRGHVLSITQIAGSLVNLVVVIGYAKLAAPTFHAIVWGTAASFLVSILIYLTAERRFWRGCASAARRPRADRAELSQILRYGLPLVPVLIITFVFQGMDKIALRAYSSLEEVGLYATANKFVFLLTIIQTGFTLFWAPTALERYEKMKESGDYRFFEKAFEYMAAVMLAAGALMLLLKDAIALLMAPSYRGAVTIMPFLILAPTMYMLGEITGIGIALRKKTYFYIVIATVAAAVNFAGNYLLIPVMGAKGAALSTGIAYTVYFAVRTGISAKLLPTRYGVMKLAPGLLVLTAFMYLNTFYTVPWWCNAAPVFAAALMHRRLFAEMLRQAARV